MKQGEKNRGLFPDGKITMRKVYLKENKMKKDEKEEG